MGARSKTSAARVQATKRREQAMLLRRSGWTFDRIADKLGVTMQRAHAMVNEGLAESRVQVAAIADELRAQQVSRLDGMLDKLYPKAAKGDVQAIDRVVKIEERRAKLFGLDAPVRTSLQGGGDDAPPIVTEARVAIYIPSNGRDAPPGKPGG